MSGHPSVATTCRTGVRASCPVHLPASVSTRDPAVQAGSPESGRAQRRARVTARTAEREAARVAVRYGNRHYVRCALNGGCCWSACSMRTAKLLARSSCERNTTRTDVRALVGGQGEGVVTSRVQPAKNLAGLWAVVRRDGCPVPARVCLRYDTGSRPRRLRHDQQHGARLAAQTSGVARLGVCTHARHRQRELARRRRHFAPGSRRSNRAVHSDIIRATMPSCSQSKLESLLGDDTRSCRPSQFLAVSKPAEPERSKHVPKLTRSAGTRLLHSDAGQHA